MGCLRTILKVSGWATEHAAGVRLRDRRFLLLRRFRSIDCKYFNFGSGCCRHGSNCFYKHEVKPGSSRRNRHANARYKRNNRQYRRRWDGDPLGFGEHVDVAELDAMLEMFAGDSSRRRWRNYLNLRKLVHLNWRPHGASNICGNRLQ